MMHVRRISAVRVSPDGKRVAYQVSSPLMNETQSEVVSQIFVANVDGTDSVQMTFGEKSSGDPQWSPDAHYLAFTSRRGGKNNLYALPMSGGEAMQLTDVKSDITSFQWSPDGKSIAFIMTDPESESEQKAAASKNDSRWYERDWRFARLYLVTVREPGRGRSEVRRLTLADYHVGTTGRAADGAFHWSPDRSEEHTSELQSR